jgi:hypothetical protein
MNKHTPGPLTVRIDDQWPFAIKTFNANGEVVFVRDMPSHSTKHKCAADALEGRGMEYGDEARVVNARAVADATLHAAAPDLLEVLQGMCSVWATVCNSKGWEPEHVTQYTDARKAIAKALGEQS